MPKCAIADAEFFYQHSEVEPDDDYCGAYGEAGVAKFTVQVGDCATEKKRRRIGKETTDNMPKRAIADAEFFYQHSEVEPDDDYCGAYGEAGVAKFTAKVGDCATEKKRRRIGKETTDDNLKGAIADARVIHTCAGAYSDNNGAGAYAEAGIAKATVKAGSLSAGASLLNASAGVEGSKTGVGAMARAELASVSAGVGPVKVKAAISADTGIKAGEDGAEVKILGTGLKIGPKTSISVLGSEAECVIM